MCIHALSLPLLIPLLTPLFIPLLIPLLIHHPLDPLLILLLPLLLHFSRLGPKFRSGKRPIFVLANDQFTCRQTANFRVDKRPIFVLTNGQFPCRRTVISIVVNHRDFHLYFWYPRTSPWRKPKQTATLIFLFTSLFPLVYPLVNNDLWRQVTGTGMKRAVWA